MDQMTVEGLKELFDKQKTDVNSLVEARLSDWKKDLASYSIDGGKEKPYEILKKDEKTKEVAIVGESGAMNFQIMNVPVIPVAGGMFAAVLATELVDGFMASSGSAARGGVKLAAAAGAFFASNKWGEKVPVLGKTGLKVIALMVAFDGLRDLIPIDTFAQKIASKISGKTTTAGLAGNNKTMKELTRTQEKDYYSAAFGR